MTGKRTLKIRPSVGSSFGGAWRSAQGSGHVACSGKSGWLPSSGAFCLHECPAGDEEYLVHWRLAYSSFAAGAFLWRQYAEPPRKQRLSIADPNYTGLNDDDRLNPILPN